MTAHNTLTSPTHGKIGGQAWHPAATCAVVAISALAWLAMASGWPGHHSPISSSTFSSGELLLAEAARKICGQPPDPNAALLDHFQWLAGWAIMVLAMMLPPTIPFLRSVGEVAGQHDRLRLVTLAALAFIALWTAVGLVLIGIAAVVAQAAWGSHNIAPALAAGTAAMLAGIYQFTPMKKACLTGCRSPRAVLMCYWNGERPDASAVKSGLRYAAICIGCCWATMGLTLIVGLYALPLMIVVSTLMLAERMLPSIRPLIPLQAGFAIAIGALLIAGWLPSSPLFTAS